MGKHHSSSDKSKHDPMTTYRNKVDKVTKWYNHLIAERENNPNRINLNSKKEAKVKELKSLQDYIDKIKKPKGI